MKQSLRDKIIYEIQDLGNNKWSYCEVVVYAPNINTAINRIIKEII